MRSRATRVTGKVKTKLTKAIYDRDRGTSVAPYTVFKQMFPERVKEAMAKADTVRDGLGTYTAVMSNLWKSASKSEKAAVQEEWKKINGKLSLEADMTGTINQ